MNRPILLAAALAASGAWAQAAPEPEARPARTSLSIDDAVALALEQNPDLIKARLQARASAQDERLALSPILPNLNFNASYGRSRIGGGEEVGRFTIPGTAQTFIQVNPVQIFPSYGIGLSVRQLIWDGGKWSNNLEAARKNLAATHETIQEQKLQTVFLVRQRFYELVRAQRQLAVLAEAAARSRDQAEAVQRLFEGGRSTQADVYAARANRDNDEVNRLGQEARVETARQDLAVAIGRDPGQPLAVVEPAELMNDPAAPPAAE